MGSFLSQPSGRHAQKTDRDILAKLPRSRRVIDRILSITGAPSVSVRVIRGGKTLYTAHHGFRDVERRLAPDNDTLHNINSMSKAFISALAAIIADTGALNLTDPVATHLPDFSFKDKGLAHQLTILDLLSHRSGLNNPDAIWLGSRNSLLLTKEDAWRMLPTLEQVAPTRSSFLYNNWAYMLVGGILEEVTGRRLPDLLRSYIFEPLGMTRTGTAWNPADCNTAKSYSVLSNLSLVEIPPPQLGAGTAMEAPGGIKSTISDLSRFYTSFLSAVMDDFRQPRGGGGKSPLTRPSIFRSCGELVTHHSTIPPASLREQGYGLGWARAQLPGPMGRIGLNPAIADPPDVGKGAPSTLVLYHNGSMPGSTTCVCLVPSEDVVILVLQNSITAVDTADIVCQLVLELLLNPTQPIDFESQARALTREAVARQGRVGAELLARRELGTTPSKPLRAYAGVYRNYVHTFSIEIRARGDRLCMRLQGLASEEFWLSHYEHDTFCWWMPHDEIMRRGRYTDYGPEHYLISFSLTTGGKVGALHWAWDPARLDRPEVFTKETFVLQKE
ncbi:beta-lactamase/transpeptidase-like protein [Thermothelomyces heterothallicus CBS 202.75]|uniref:beta-lactamase/transpeptidase-like protein n=1 Tax=Thermothelomyces heterothallicus CBS 202.75 TaxID=1149848 RepID=UPI00374311F0